MDKKPRSRGPRSAKGLKEAEENYRQLIEDIDDGYLVVRGNRVLFANKRVAAFLGRPVAEIIGGPFVQLLTPDSREKAAQIYERTRSGEPPPEIEEFAVQREDGSSVSLEVRFKQITYAGERAYSLLLRDITERRRAEEALRESQERYERLVESAPDLIVHIDSNGRLAFMNAYALHRLGYAQDEVLGRDFWEFLAPESIPIGQAAFEKARTGEPVKDVEITLQAKNGEMTLFELRSIPSFIEGEFLGGVAILRDITERKRVEEALKQSEGKFRHLVEDISDGYIVLRGERVIFANKRSREIVGYGEKQIGQPFTKFLAPEVLEDVMELYRRSMRGEPTPERYESVFLREDGTRVPVEISAKDIIYEGKPAVSQIIRDISERKRAEEEILSHTKRLEALHAIAQTVSQTLDLDELLDTALAKVLEVTDLDAGVIYFIDTEARELVLKAHSGVSEEFVGTMGRIKVAEADIQRWQEEREPTFGLERMLDEATLAGVTAVIEREGMQSYVGTSMWSKEMLRGVMVLSSRSKRWFTPGDLELLNVISNQIAVAIENAELFEQTRARAEELRESQERLNALIENAPDAIFVHDLEARFIDGNKKAEEMIGYSREEVIGRSFLELGLLPEESLPTAIAALEKSIKGEPSGPDEYELIRKDGSRVSIEITSFPVERGGKVEVIGMARDISERKRAEDEILRHTERLAVTAELTRIMVSSLNIKEVFEAFVAGVKKLVDADRITINLIEGDMVRVLVTSSEMDTALRSGAVVPLEGSAAQWVMTNRRAIIEADLAQERQFYSDETHFREGLRSAIRLPLFSKGEVFGTFNLVSRHPNAYGEREKEMLEELAGQIAVAIENDRLYEEAKQRKEELEVAYNQLVESSKALERGRQELEDAYLKMARTLVLTLEARDPYTRGHSDRVAQLARQTAFELRLSHEEMRKIETAARLHDLGKIGIPDGILLKPSAITPSERAEIQLHPTRAVDLLRHLGFLNGTLSVIEHHHERYNGGGYPNSLRGEETPMGARILAVADAYDAMTSARPYRPAMASEQAIEILREGAGTQWDADVIEAFLRAFGN